AVAVVADGDEPAFGVEGEVDAWPVVGLVGLDPPADAGVVGVLDQLADADLLRGVEVLGEDLEEPGKVEVEALAVAHHLSRGSRWTVLSGPPAGLSGRWTSSAG